MKKLLIGSLAGFLGFAVAISLLLGWANITPEEEIPEELRGYVGYYTGEGGKNEVDGIVWLTPCNYTVSTRRYGMDYHPTQHVWKMHFGVDMGAPQGTPIYATRSGTVVVAAYDPDSCGNYVVLQHGDDFRSTYMHMVYYIVSAGQQVRQGQVIGYVGSTGDSTGPHLHFEISYQGQRVDPELYIDMSKRPTDDPTSKPVTDSEKEVM